MVKFSIIMPVYNGEKYIEKAIESVLKQSYHSYELIIVNDGSTDNTQVILEEVTSNKITLINKANAGVSVARNTGLQAAKGEYIMFLDQDDEFIGECLLDLSQALFESDLIIGTAMNKVFNNHIEVIKMYEDFYSLKSYNLDEYRNYFVSEKNNIGVWACWRHIYKKTFLVDNNITFDNKYAFGEDVDFVLNCFNKMESFVLYTQPFVNYRIHESQVSANYSFPHALGNIQVLIKWIRYYQQFKEFKETKQRLANKLMAIIAHINHLSDVEKSRLIVLYQENQDCLRYCSGKFRIIMYLIKFIGYQRVISLVAKAR